MQKKKIAIIPARGGSKRIPRKNIKDFLGKPIIAYSIEAAINSGLFDEIMVSTDDSDIAKVAQDYGAKIPFMRSERNSDDFATTADVILEVLAEYEKLGKKFDYFCCIYPTAPFTSSDKLKNAFKLLTDEQSDSVIPVVQFSYPIQRAFKINNNMELKYISPENINKRSQDLETAYHDAGQFYWARTETFLKEKTLACGKTKPFILKESEVQDIDNEYDWELAEIKFSRLYSHS